MTLHTGVLRLRTDGNGETVDLTEGVKRVVLASEARDGLVTVFVTGSTAAITTMEYEPGGVRDLRELLERIAPPGLDYAHNAMNNDTNAHAHLRASLIGASETIPLVDGHLALGTWQQVVLLDFDVRSRDRTVTVQVHS